MESSRVLPVIAPNQHLGASDSIAVFVVPVVAFGRSDFDDGDAGIIDAFGEPRFEDRVPLAKFLCLWVDVYLDVQR